MGTYENEIAVLREDIMESTVDPNVSIISEVPTLTVTTILGVTIVVLIAIIMVFVLGVLIDWRQQRLMDKKIGEVKRMKNNRKKVNHPDADVICIANNMEEPSTSIAPAESIRNIP